MSQSVFLFLLYMDVCIGVAFYSYVFRMRRFIGFQLGMNISLLMGGMAAILSGVLLIVQYPFHYTLITILSTLIGAAVGALFGLVFDDQTFMTGWTNGMMIGLMAPMIGTVVEGMDLFILFIHVLLVMSVWLMYISVKRS
ncbi:hypothetical protein [Bacillus sp. REN10]|uniref:hypothetical protein n=1 Tax=Bacillus sp. REN10 TaxID=2782541 RepID=UPI00193B9FEA|nr:hypothetical protein [Bacillus sp. REN10]